MSAKVAIVKCDSYERQLVSEKVAESIRLLGGIAEFVKPGSRVLVKPNLLMPVEPDSGVVTHPEVVRGVIRVLKTIDCKILVGDGPCALGDVSGRIDEVFEKSGIMTVCLEEKVSLLKFERKRWRNKFPLAAAIDECDSIVNVPKFKTHNLMVLTGAVKNLFGLVWSIHKTELHKKYFHPEEFAGILVDIFQEAKPALTVVDGIVAMEGDGPGTSGKLRRENLILAGGDCVALDSVLALLMGLKPMDILSTKEAQKRGLGEADIDSISILGEQINNVIGKPFILPSASKKLKIPRPLLNALKQLIRYFPYVQRESCIRCGLCVEGCPNKAISMKPRGIVFDYKKCISCFCCQEFCPSAAIKTGKNWFTKLVGL